MSEVHKFVNLLNKVAIYCEIEFIVRVSCHAFCFLDVDVKSNLFCVLHQTV